MTVKKRVRTTVTRSASITSSGDGADSKFTARVTRSKVEIRNPQGWGLSFVCTTENVDAFYDLAAAILQEHRDAQAVEHVAE